MSNECKINALTAATVIVPNFGKQQKYIVSREKWKHCAEIILTNHCLLPQYFTPLSFNRPHTKCKVNSTLMVFSWPKMGSNAQI